MTNGTQDGRCDVNTREKILQVEKEIQSKEKEIDRLIYGGLVTENGPGERPSMFSYRENLWEEEIKQDRSLKKKLEKARKLQTEIRALDNEYGDLLEEAEGEIIG